LQDISFGSSFGVGIRLNNIEESVEKMKKNIESYIEKLNMKILIFIDDIDRLQLEEVSQVLASLKIVLI